MESNDEELNESQQGEDLFYAPPPDHITGEVDDLASLTNLNADTLLKELQIRYERDVIYTFVSDILVAVNPFKALPIYGQDTKEVYNKKQRWEVAPHIFTVADACYTNLTDMNKSQCAVISGESGAGKTESAKLVMKHIIDLCRMRGVSDGSLLEQQIIQVNPLLEAFGNAQTAMNDNSSRFGKYTRMIFDTTGAVIGIQLSEYLLEKSRVVEQAQGERNFHVFYYLFSHPEREKLMLTNPGDYQNLGGQLWDDNATMFNELQQAMNVVGFSQTDVDTIYAILAACIHLSNINFEGSEASHVKDRSKIEYAAQLLQIEKAQLEEVLLGIETVTRGETIRRLYKPNQAYDCRDALAKALYGSLFGWLVNNINRMLAPELHVSDNVPSTLEIGVLDIFGFENFKSNSFEQICINLAHEQLQYFFNKHTFSLELEEYALEGIDGKEISFRDNLSLIQMFLDKPIGILSLLDEECTFPNATDATFTLKLNENFGNRTGYNVVKMSRGYPAFSIEHFAGAVEYNATNFLEKNRDNLAANIVDLMQQSKVQIVQDVFMGEVLSTGQIRPRYSSAAGGDKQVYSKVNRKSPTLSAQFKNSLAILMDRMTKCFPHFVRCIKPNLGQRPNNFIPEFVKTQLLYTGVLEVTRIRQEGFAWRPPFDEFVRRYKIIAFHVSELDSVEETQKNAIKIIKRAGLEKWLVGRNKLFLKYYHFDTMEKKLERFFRDIVRSQGAVRRHFALKELKKLQARARMEKAERERLEKIEAEENRKKEEERRRKKEEADRKRLAEEARVAELKKQEKARKEEEAKRLAEERAAKGAERLRAEEEARIASEQARLLAERREAESALEIADKAAQEAEKFKRERELVLAEAEMARMEAEQRMLEIEMLRQEAEKARKEKEAAEDEAKQIAIERKKSRKLRQAEFDEAARHAAARAEAEARAAEEAMRAQEAAEAEAKRLEAIRDAEEKSLADEKQAKLRQRLQQMEAEAKAAKALAEQQAKAAADALKAKIAAEELAKKKEEERIAEEKRAMEEKMQEEQERMEADVTRPEFNLVKRVAKLTGKPTDCKDVTLEPRRCQGWVAKMKARDTQAWMGFLARKGNQSWTRRYFLLDLDQHKFEYYENEKLKKLKSTIPTDSLVRVYAPPVSTTAQLKTDHLFMIETTQRTYFCQAPSEQSKDLWIAALSTMCNNHGSSASLNLSTMSAGSSSASVMSARQSMYGLSVTPKH